MLRLQALLKLHGVLRDNAWVTSTINVVVDFLRLLLGVGDDLAQLRAGHILCEPHHGLAIAAHREK